MIIISAVACACKTSEAAGVFTGVYVTVAVAVVAAPASAVGFPLFFASMYLGYDGLAIRGTSLASGLIWSYSRYATDFS